MRLALRSLVQSGAPISATCSGLNDVAPATGAHDLERVQAVFTKRSRHALTLVGGTSPTIPGVRVLVWPNDAYAAIPGGHHVQLDRTVEALRRQSVDVAFETGPDASLQGVDVVHSFGAQTSWLRRARQAGIPVVMSTIYVSQRYVFGFDHRGGRRKRLARIVRLTGSMARRGPEVTASRVMAPVLIEQLAFESADLLLPNSEAEARTIRDELGVSTPMHVVPNGVDHRTFVMSATAIERTGVLYAGRVEPHKNQLGLIQALAGTGIPLTIVGPTHPHHLAYMAACRRAAGSLTKFIDGRDQAGLVALYQGAAVHAMPSWFETTGLTSLEASLCGAAIVTTERGYVRDYFTDLAHYCDPASQASIRAAVEAALESGGSAKLRERILDNYTWDHTASATLEAYNVALARA